MRLCLAIMSYALRSSESHDFCYRKKKTKHTKIIMLKRQSESELNYMRVKSVEVRNAKCINKQIVQKMSHKFDIFLHRFWHFQISFSFCILAFRALERFLGFIIFHLIFFCFVGRNMKILH